MSNEHTLWMGDVRELSYSHSFDWYRTKPQMCNGRRHVPLCPACAGIGKMRKCGMRNAESKMRNEKCGMYVRNGV